MKYDSMKMSGCQGLNDINSIYLADFYMLLLSGEPDSGIEKERKVVHVALHPKFVNNISLGLVNHFNKLINQWHPQLNGLLAGYGRLQLKRPTGNMINEEAHLHLDVQSDFWIFRPTVGRRLKGDFFNAF